VQKGQWLGNIDLFGYEVLRRTLVLVLVVAKQYTLYYGGVYVVGKTFTDECIVTNTYHSVLLGVLVVFRRAMHRDSITVQIIQHV
jgi:hypothetical protein